MRKSVLKKRKAKLWEKCIEVELEYPKSLNELSNELLYFLISNPLTESSYMIDEGLRILTWRLRPMMLDVAGPWCGSLGWTADDIVQEGRILLWELVGKRCFVPRITFKRYFKTCYRNRICNIYRKGMRHNPDTIGNVVIGYDTVGPIFAEHTKFNIDYILRDNAGGRKHEETL